jgi:hypothetical protein
MQRRISKFVNGWWNVGKQQQQINAKDFVLLCPRCKLCRKMTKHVMYCSCVSPETQEYRTTLKETINSVTPKTITGMILSILCRLSVEPDHSPRPTIPDTLPQRAAMRSARQYKNRPRSGGLFFCKDTWLNPGLTPTANCPVMKRNLTLPRNGAQQSSTTCGHTPFRCGNCGARSYTKTNKDCNSPDSTTKSGHCTSKKILSCQWILPLVPCSTLASSR